MLTPSDLNVENLGPCEIASPLRFDAPGSESSVGFVSDSVRIRLNIEVGGAAEADDLSFEKAGPRRRIYFPPAQTTVAIVTCGGLSPGLNNVIRSVFYELRDNYGVHDVLGIRNGYVGLDPASGREPMVLTHESVSEIHKLGGSVLGSSRGPVHTGVMADFLAARGVNILICLGGDGTQRGAQALYEEFRRRGMKIAVIGIPKTIDNDIPFVRQSFGFATALEKAGEVIRGAHVEARDAINGIGLVKLMGRYAGFIAAGATVVSQEVNFTLVPEIAFSLEGPDGFLAALEQRMRDRGHAVIVVAEGAGQHLFGQGDCGRDASGNLLNFDIGALLREKIKCHFDAAGLPIALKYLDPSYFVRSVPANAYDRYLCDQMGRHAVHAAMAGKTGMLIGLEHMQFIHVPIPAVVAREKRMETGSDLWRAVLQVTRQPRW